MNTMLSVLLALVLSVTFCDAVCTQTPLEMTLEGEVEGCRDSKGVIHKFDTQWESDCVRCSCDPVSGLICCSTLIRPKGYDKAKCKEVFNWKTCRVNAVEKANPAATCKVTQYLG